MAALCSLERVPRFIEGNLVLFLHATELPDNEYEGGQHVNFDADGNVVDYVGARLVQGHAKAARAAIARGDCEGAAVEGGRARLLLVMMRLRARVGDKGCRSTNP